MQKIIYGLSAKDERAAAAPAAGVGLEAPPPLARLPADNQNLANHAVSCPLILLH